MRKMGAISTHQKLWTIVDVSSLAEAISFVSEKVCEDMCRFDRLNRWVDYFLIDLNEYIGRLLFDGVVWSD